MQPRLRRRRRRRRKRRAVSETGGFPVSDTGGDEIQETPFPGLLVSDGGAQTSLLAKAVLSATGHIGHQHHTISYAAGIPLSILKREERIVGGTFNRLFASFMVAGRSLPSIKKRNSDYMWRSTWAWGVLAWRQDPKSEIWPRKFLRSLRNGWVCWSGDPDKPLPYKLAVKLHRRSCERPNDVLTVWGDSAKRVLRCPPDHFLQVKALLEMALDREYDPETLDPYEPEALVHRLRGKEASKFRALNLKVPRENFLFQRVGTTLIGRT